MHAANASRVLCRLSELPDPGSKSVVVDQEGKLRELFVVRRGAAAYAYLNSCPHTGAPLDWMPDQFLNIDGTLIQCATHHALFRMEDGFCVSGPCAGQALQSVPVRVEGELVILEDRRFADGEGA